MNAQETTIATAGPTTRRSSFGFTARYVAGMSAPEGELSYQDKASGLRLKSTGVTMVVISGTHAVITGAGTVNGVPVDWRLEVDDLREPGRSDTLHTTVDRLCRRRPLLNGGNIQIHR